MNKLYKNVYLLQLGYLPNYPFLKRNSICQQLPLLSFKSILNFSFRAKYCEKQTAFTQNTVEND